MGFDGSVNTVTAPATTDKLAPTPPVDNSTAEVAEILQLTLAYSKAAQLISSQVELRRMGEDIKAKIVAMAALEATTPVAKAATLAESKTFQIAKAEVELAAAATAIRMLLRKLGRFTD